MSQEEFKREVVGDIGCLESVKWRLAASEASKWLVTVGLGDAKLYE